MPEEIKLTASEDKQLDAVWDRFSGAYLEGRQAFMDGEPLNSRRDSQWRLGWHEAQFHKTQVSPRK